MNTPPSTFPRTVIPHQPRASPRPARPSSTPPQLCTAVATLWSSESRPTTIVITHTTTSGPSELLVDSTSQATRANSHPASTADQNVCAVVWATAWSPNSTILAATEGGRAAVLTA